MFFFFFLPFPGDVEHTHLVKGLDYALLNKVRSEIDKKPDTEDEKDGNSRYLVLHLISNVKSLVPTESSFHVDILLLYRNTL